MRYITFALLALFSVNVTAQETETDDIEAQEKITILPKQRKNEVGMLSNLGLTENNPGPAIGIQYKHWVKANKQAIRANVGYSQYTKSSSKVYFPAQGDTVLSRVAFSEIPTVTAGIGIETQRHFYKALYMYAAIDVYGIYGSGTTTEQTQKEVTKDNTTHTSDYRRGISYTSDILRIGVLPLVGIKFQFSRISFGTELSGLRMEYNSLTHGAGGPANTGGIVDFNMGDFSQRIFINFRF